MAFLTIRGIFICILITTIIGLTIFLCLSPNLQVDHLSPRQSLPLSAQDQAKEALIVKLSKLNEDERRFNLINDSPDDDDHVDKPAKSEQQSIPSDSPEDEKDIIQLGLIRGEDDRKVKEDGLKKYAFNVLISNRIGPHRRIPDTRYPLCKNKTYSPLEDLPKSSIIICFYNEAYSVLERTVTSILKRTQRALIEEIILVDDFSDDDSIRQRLKKKYRDGKSSVKLLRTPERAGLIRARMYGAKHAVGEILVFLDSHCEVNVDWLRPLVQRVHENRKVVTVPIIDIINHNTFEYTASPLVRGGFNWGLHFKWDSIPRHLLRNKQDYIKGIPSPTMAGGLFAMDRKYFHELGEYDPGMDIWGGENLEISFRVWMCGGSIEIMPCSRVGHVFRQRRPYGSPSGEDTLSKNSLRVANVWMDDYKKYYYEMRKDLVSMDYGSISDRVRLRNKLGCKSFEWYLKNVYPELKLPVPGEEEEKRRKKLKSLKFNKSRVKSYTMQKTSKPISIYQIQLAGSNLCIESEKEVTAKKSRLILKKCQDTKRQVWFETGKRELRLANGLCLDADDDGTFLAKCHEFGDSQEWRHSSEKNTPFYNLAAGMCLGTLRVKVGEPIMMTICSYQESRKWNLIPRTSFKG